MYVNSLPLPVLGNYLIALYFSFLIYKMEII